MHVSKFILTHDLGTTGNKAVLFDFDLNVIAQAREDYPLYYPKPGFAEQEPSDFWNAVKNTTIKLLEDSNVNSSDVKALVFDCQMNCTIPIDNYGNPLMRAISWLDVRAASLIQKKLGGLIKISGFGITKLLKFLKITGGAPGTNGKDPISHILWLNENQPDLYNNTFKFLSVKDYIIYKCTEKAVTSRDLGHTSWLMNSNPEIFDWAGPLLKKYKIDSEKLPEIRKSSEIAGNLNSEAANNLSLNKETPVFVGSGDIISGAVGSGAAHNQLIACLGTADWIAAHVTNRIIDLTNYTGSISSIQDKYLCISKQETGAVCLNWTLDNMYQDEKQRFKGKIDEFYSYIDDAALNAPVGSRNLIFTPWMFGERSPINDSNVRAGFYNLSLEHDRSDLLRSVYEGVGFNMKWAHLIVEGLLKKKETLKTETVNFVGGGAKSEPWCQILSDIFQKDVNQMLEPDLAAAKGSAVIALIGLGKFNNIEDAMPYIKIQKTYTPNPDNQDIYENLFAEYLNIYKNNKAMFKTLNK